MATWTAHDSLWLCDDFQSLWERPNNQGLQILWKARACAKLVIEYILSPDHEPALQLQGCS